MKPSTGPNRSRSDRTDKPVNRSSDRSFGAFFAMLALISGVWPMLYGDRPILALLVCGSILLFVAAATPKVLAPLNRLWFEFGLLLHRLVSPLVLGLIFLTSVIPVGLLMQLFGKDPMRRRFEPGLPTYWISRDPPGPQADALPRQF